MAIDREAIYSALWDRVSGAAQFVTAERRLRHWTDVSAAEQPAIFMTVKRQHAITEQRAVSLPTSWILEADIFVYVNCSDPYLAPAILLNPLLDAIELALAPDIGTGIQDLGLPQMVRHARIQGEVQMSEGILGDQEIAVVPVEIYCL